MHPGRIVLPAVFALFASSGWPQASLDSLKFEVATLKDSPPGEPGAGIRPLPGGQRYEAVNLTLKGIMVAAYRVKADQIVGGPSWIDTDRFDMNAKAERSSNIEELHAMLRNLLKEQFKLEFHRETKELPIYSLSLDRGGPKLQPHDAQNSGDPRIDIEPDPHPGGFLKMVWHARFSPVDYFAFRLGQIMDRPVIDRTRLKGGFDFNLAFTRDLPPGMQEGALINGAQVDTSGPTIFEAVQKQLGLRLDRQKGPAEIIVVDRAEKPVAN
jgi:uncharacterized protein (TIGR03435 family)